MKKNLCMLAVGLAFFAGATQANAQYRYRYPQRRPPVPVPVPYGGVVAPYAGRGGALAGGAQMVDAQGNFMVQQEQARMDREKAYQEHLKSQKATVEYNKWLEQNTPTYTETKEKEAAMRTRRILNSPTTYEIYSGESLNASLKFLQQLGDQGYNGPPVSVEQGWLADINVTVPGTKGEAGMLRNGGKVHWPLGLQGNPLQKKIAKELPLAVAAAADGKLQFQQYKDLRDSVKALRDESLKKYATDKMDAEFFLEADNFLQKLDDAVFELKKPSTARLLRSQRPYGRNVQELVYNMSRNGLEFAPVTAGGESSYAALQNAMTRYAIGANSSFGFQVQAVAPRKNFRVEPLPKKKTQ